MSLHQSRQQDGSGDDEQHPLDRETETRILPREWLADAERADVPEEATEYYPVLHTVERDVSGDSGVLAGEKPGRAEQWTVHVLFVRGDGRRRIEKPYPAKVIETGDGTRVVPKGLEASLAVDGTMYEPVSRLRSELVERALRLLHGISVEADS